MKTNNTAFDTIMKYSTLLELGVDVYINILEYKPTYIEGHWSLHNEKLSNLSGILPNITITGYTEDLHSFTIHAKENENGILQPEMEKLMKKKKREDFCRLTGMKGAYEPKMSKELIVFTNNGKTFSFSGVENFQHTTQGFKFDYQGISSGKKRTAEFNYTSVSGYAFD